jgi:hypothetical protein
MIIGFLILPFGDFGCDIKVAWISSKYGESYLNLSEVVGSPNERLILDYGLFGNFFKSIEFRSD